MNFKEANSTRLMFGKYKGKTLDEVPLDYLDWLMGQEWFSTRPEYEAVRTYLDAPSIKELLERELEEDE